MKWIPLSPWRPGASQDVAVGSASAQSTAMGARTHAVGVASTVDCRVEIGENPTATSTSMLISGGREVQVFGISPGEKVAVIEGASATAGTLNIVEMTH